MSIESSELRTFLKEFALQLRVVLTTGKIRLGYNSTLRALQRGFAKAVIIARNLPEDKKKLLKYLCRLANVPFFEAPINSDELGEILRRPHRVASLAILDIGSSNIIQVISRFPSS